MQGQEVPTRSRSPTKVKKSRQGLEVPARSTSYSKVYKFQRVLEVCKKSSVEIYLGLCQVGIATEIWVLLSPNGASPAGGGGRPIA